MKSRIRVFLALTIAALCVCGACVQAAEFFRLDSNEIGDRTHLEEGKQGQLEQVWHAGHFTIEQRSYWDGMDLRQPVEFCHYWIEYDGRPVDVLPYGDVNYYNNCNAVLIGEGDGSAFVIGVKENGGQAYIPLLVSVNLEGQVVASRFFPHPECRYAGWPQPEEHRVDLCGRTIDLRDVGRMQTPPPPTNTPPPAFDATPRRATPVPPTDSDRQVRRVGGFTIEQRRYLAGRSRTPYCSYSIRFNGEPVDLPSAFGYEDHYNNCRAVLIGEGILPAFIFGAPGTDGGEDYRAALFSETPEGPDFITRAIRIDNNKPCAYPSELRMNVTGLPKAQDHRVDFCGQIIDLRDLGKRAQRLLPPPAPTKTRYPWLPPVPHSFRGSMKAPAG